MTNPSNHSLREQVLALAGVVQAATLVDKLARTGYCDSALLETQVHTLLETDPENTEAVFGSLASIREGVNVLCNLLKQESNASPEVMRYVLGMINIEGKLKSRKDMLGMIGSRLVQTRSQVEHFNSEVHESVLDNLASLYTDTISTFRFRIQVNGNPMYLQQPAVVSKIRTLLFSGIRCAVLWRQTGGGRFKLLWQRQKYVDATEALLVEIDHLSLA